MDLTHTHPAASCIYKISRTFRGLSLIDLSATFAIKGSVTGAFRPIVFFNLSTRYKRDGIISNFFHFRGDNEVQVCHINVTEPCPETYE